MSSKVTMSFPPEIRKKIDRLAKASNRTTANQILVMVKDCLGVKGLYPCILSAGNTYIWVSPTGAYGEMTKMAFIRFMAGSLPMSIGVYDDWMNVFDTMQEACESLGTEVCRQASNGLVITDVSKFTKLYEQFHKGA